MARRPPRPGLKRWRGSCRGRGMSLLRSMVLPFSLALSLVACGDSPTDRATPVSASTEAPPVSTPTGPNSDAHYASALELAAAGRIVDARAAVGQALTAGAGRDAKLLAAQLAILDGDLESAASNPRAARVPPLRPTRSRATTSASSRSVAANTTWRAASISRPCEPTPPCWPPGTTSPSWPGTPGWTPRRGTTPRSSFELAPDHPRSARLRAQLASGSGSGRDTNNSSRVASNSLARIGLVK